MLLLLLLIGNAFQLFLDLSPSFGQLTSKLIPFHLRLDTGIASMMLQQLTLYRREFPFVCLSRSQECLAITARRGQHLAFIRLGCSQ